MTNDRGSIGSKWGRFDGQTQGEVWVLNIKGAQYLSSFCLVAFEKISMFKKFSFKKNLPW